MSINNRIVEYGTASKARHFDTKYVVVGPLVQFLQALEFRYLDGNFLLS